MRTTSAIATLLLCLWAAPAVGRAGPEGAAPPARTPRFVLARTLKGPSGLVRTLAVHPTDGTLAAGSSDRALRIWDVAAGTLGATLTLPPGEG